MNTISDASPIMAEHLESIDLARAERDRLARTATHSVCVDFFGTSVEVVFDDGDAAGRYARRYARFTSERSRTSARAFALRDGSSTLFWYDDRRAFRWQRAMLDSAAIDFLADSVVRREFFAAASFLTFHAAAVEVERGAVAIVAPSTGGKSTTSIACARRGLRLFTDEECVTRDGRVHPFPRAMNLRADGIERILADPSFDDSGIRARLLPHRGEAWLGAGFDDLFGAIPLPQPRTLVAVYFISAHGPNAEIVPLARGEAVKLLLSAWPRGDRTGIDRVSDILGLLTTAPPFALTLGTPDATALAIRDAGRA